MRNVVNCCFVAGLCLGFVIRSGAQEWTRFRGPNGSGISLAKTIPTRWTEADFNWKVALPGGGHSSPVLWGEKIFVTASDEKAGKFFVLCFNAGDGRQLWQKEFTFTPHSKHELNSFASSTPAVDAERVYLYRTQPTRNVLFALDHRGEKVWERDLGPFVSQQGGATSLILHEGAVIFANEQDGEGSSFLLSVDARTGEPRWKTPRKTSVASYSTPCVFQPSNGPPALIFNSQSHGISAIAPDTGKVLWDYATAFDKRSVSSPVIAAGLIIGSCGSGGGGNYVVAVRPGDPARNQKAELAYDMRRSAPYVPTAVCTGDKLFLWSEAGIVSYVDAPSGTVKWQERAEGNYYSSPVWVDGRLFCISTTGEVVVVAAADRFEVLARNALGEPTHSSPAVAGGRMYIRTSEHLYSIGGKASP